MDTPPGVFSSRKIERATYENLAFRYIASDLHPDHDTIANFRKTFLAEIQELFVQILLLAQAADILKLGNISIDGSKIHADASKSKAVSYKRLVELEAQIRKEVADLMTLGEQVDQGELHLPEGLVIPDEIGLRQERLAKLARAKAVLEARAKERFEGNKPNTRPNCMSGKKKPQKQTQTTRPPTETARVWTTQTRINSTSPTRSRAS
jgi:hypothetical protein